MTDDLNLPFCSMPRDGLVCCGKLDESHLDALAKSGVKTVINLCGHPEMDWDEAGSVQAHGMEYLHLPVNGPPDLSKENALMLTDWLKERDDRTVVVHCASSNRVGALLALGSALEGASIDDALAIGRSAGMTRLEPVVMQLLKQWLH